MTDPRGILENIKGAGKRSYMVTDNLFYLLAALNISRSSSWEILNDDDLTTPAKLAQLCKASESKAIRKIGERFEVDHFAVYEGDDYKAIALVELFEDYVDGVYITDESGEFLRVVLKQ